LGNDRTTEIQGEVRSAAFGPDGTRVVTASWDDTAQVWDAATGKPLTSALEHQGEVVSATFSPDGTRVVTASHDKTARVWDALVDEGTLADWGRTAERSPFVLDGIALVRRASDLGRSRTSDPVSRLPPLRPSQPSPPEHRIRRESTYRPDHDVTGHYGCRSEAPVGESSRGQRPRAA
jgi:WD40 repeat protein